MKKFVFILFILSSFPCHSQAKLSEYDSVRVQVENYLAEKKSEILKLGISNTIEKSIQKKDSSVIAIYIDVNHQQIDMSSGPAGTYTRLGNHEPDSLLFDLLKKSFLKLSTGSEVSVNTLDNIMHLERGYLYSSAIYQGSHENKRISNFVFLEVFEPIGGWQNLYINFYSSKKPLEEKTWLVPFKDNEISIPMRFFQKRGEDTVIKKYIYTISFNCSDKGVINLLKGDLLLIK